MTDDLKREWRYRYQERLGMLCGTRPPTAQESLMARKDADEAISALTAYCEQSPVSDPAQSPAG